MSESPPLITSLSFAYVENEDRLALLVTPDKGDALALMLTRRLTGRLVNGLAGLLKQTSAVAREVPLQARDDVVQFEHQGALAMAPVGKSDQPAGESRQVPFVLVQSIVVSTHTDHFTIEFQGNGPPALAVMRADRNDLHRVVAVLRQKCEEADWNVAIEAVWLDGPVTEMTLN